MNLDLIAPAIRKTRPEDWRSLRFAACAVCVHAAVRQADHGEDCLYCGIKARSVPWGDCCVRFHPLPPFEGQIQRMREAGL